MSNDKKCPSQLDSWEAVHAYEHATRRGMGMLPGGPALFEQLCALAKSTFAPSSTSSAPIAWRHRSKVMNNEWGDWRYQEKEPRGPADDKFQMEPLYASSATGAASKPVQDATRKLLQWFVKHPELARELDPIMIELCEAVGGFKVKTLSDASSPNDIHCSRQEKP